MARRKAFVLLVATVAALALLCSYHAGSVSRAASAGQVTELARLLRKGADAEAPDEYGWTPLHWTAARGHRACALLLLDSGVAVDPRDRYGWTPLHCAVAHGHNDVVRLLLAGGADANARIRQGFLPQDASRWGSPRRRPPEGSGRDLCLTSDLTALHIAVIKGNVGGATLLIAGGAEPNIREGKLYHMPLHMAAASGQESMGRLLLDAGAGVGASSRQGTPLHVAARSAQRAFVELLLESGAEVDARGPVGTTALHMCAMPEDGVAAAEILVAHGCDISPLDDVGQTPLHYAAQWERTELVSFLLLNGAEVAHPGPGPDGCTASATDLY